MQDKNEHTHQEVASPDGDHAFDGKLAEESSEVAIEAIGGDLDDLPPRYYLHWRFIGTLAAVITMIWGLYLGYILPANTFTAINADIGPDPNFALIPVVKTLCGGVGLLLIGRLSDIFGRRWFMITGQIMAIIGAIICATAKNINTVIGGTIFIGLAGAIQTSFSFILMELIANKHRGILTGFLFLAGAPLSAFGPLIARMLLAHTELAWRWNYYLALIINAICGILFFIFYHPPTYKMLHKGKTVAQGLKELDWGGIFLYTAGLTTFVLGLSWGGGLYPWKSAATIAPIVLGFMILVAFCLYEIYVPLKSPLVPATLFKNGQFMAIVGVASVASMFYYSLTVIWPQMITALYTSNAVIVGLMSGVVGGTTSLGQVVGGLTARFGYSYWQVRISAVCMVAFIGAIAAADPSTKTMSIALCALGCIAVGVVEVLGIIAAPFTVAPGDLGLASGFLGSCRSSLGSVAIAIFSSVLRTERNSEVPPRIQALAAEDKLSAATVKSVLTYGLTGQVTALAKLTEIPVSRLSAYIDAIQQANIIAFRMVFFSSLAFGGISIVCAFFVRSFDRHFTNNVARRLQGMPKEDKLTKGEKAV